MITGETIYNLAAIGNVETGENDRPMDPIPHIKSTEVTVNPFKDIIVSNLIPKSEKISEDINTEKVDSKQKEQKVQKKVIKNKNLISFEDEEDDSDDGLKNKIKKRKKKFKSSHELLNDPKLSRDEVVDVNELKAQRRRRELKDQRKQELKDRISEKVKLNSNVQQTKSQDIPFSPLLPTRIIKTSASVPAPRLSPVVT